MNITLVAFNDVNNIDWDFGVKFQLKYTINSLTDKKDEILKTASDYILFWDAKNTIPTAVDLQKVINSKGDLWHIGTKIGLQEQPKLLDEIQPTNMLHVVVSDKINHSSWKNTFKGCLLKSSVFKVIPLVNYSNSLDISALDFGYKSMKSGVLTRYSATLAKNIQIKRKINLLKKEELLFIKNNFDKKALIWSYLTNCLSISPITFFKVFKTKKNSFSVVYNHNNLNKENKKLSVSAVIATLDRYTVLKEELLELSKLKFALDEIIIIDQTPIKKRNKDFLEGYQNLPIVYLETDKIGQCSARNIGVKTAKSDFIWFLDDDMKEIPSSYLLQHLNTIYITNADVSCGVPDEIGTKYIDRAIPKIELSDGFPTNDVLVKRDLLIEVEGFDVKMDQKQSEDQEIGLRLVKNGALIVKNNQLRILHLRASRGGLRAHKVRRITFSSSRNTIFQRRFIHNSEIYLNLKHFTKEKTNKNILLNIRGTFIVRGSIFKKITKVFIALILLPHTLFKTYKNVNLAKQLFNE